MIERDREAGVVRGRSGIPARQRIEYAQGAARATRWRHWGLAVTAAQGSDAVAVARGGPGRDRTGTRRLHRLEAHPGTEVQRRRGIGDDQAQPLALGLVDLTVGATGARGDAPVDMTGVVTGDVLARLGVLHATAAQR